MHVNKGLTSIQTGKVKHFSFKKCCCFFFWCKHMDVSLTCWNAWSPHGFVLLLIQNLQVTHFAFWKHRCDRPPRSPFSGVSMFTKSRQFASAISRANKYAVIPKGSGEPSDEIPLMTNMFHQHFLISQPSSRRVLAASTSLRRHRTVCPTTLQHAEPTHVPLLIRATQD